jgi:hypothetical protein
VELEHATETQAEINAIVDWLSSVLARRHDSHRPIESFRR